MIHQEDFHENQGTYSKKTQTNWNADWGYPHLSRRVYFLFR